MPGPVASVKSYIVDSDIGGGRAIYSQRYDANGNKIGDPLQVKTAVDWALVLSTTLLSDGKFVIAYRFTEPFDPWAPKPFGEWAALAEFNADGSVLATKDFPASSFSTGQYVEVKALTGGTYAYIHRVLESGMNGTTSTRSLGFVDATGQARETAINQDQWNPFMGSDPHYHPGEPILKLLAGGHFSVSYSVSYQSDFIVSPDQASPRPDASALWKSDKFYDASGHLETSISVTFDNTRTTERYDPASGAETSSTVMHSGGSRVDTQFGITGRSYVEQATYRDATGFVTEAKRYYGDEKHTLAFDQKFFIDGTGEVHNYDTLGRETVHQIGDLRGEHDVTLSTYAGTGTAPVSTVLTHYGTAGTKEFTDTTRADGSHLQQSLAAGVTLASHEKVADTFTAFSGGSDTFAFAPSFGRDIVKGFASGGGAGHDVLQFDDRLLGSTADFASHLHQTGGDTLIFFDDGSSVLLKNVAAASLTADNVQIVHHGDLLA